MVLVYIEEERWPDLEFYENVGLVQITQTIPPTYAVFEKKPCACQTRNELAICENIFSKSLLDSTVGYSAYRIDPKVNRQELETVITWLTQSNYNTFTTWIESGSLMRGLTAARHKLFRKTATKLCGCHEYRLTATPVFHLQDIVVSGDKKGPTLESVLDTQ